jgi:Tfp pilus assembly protein PilN
MAAWVGSLRQASDSLKVTIAAQTKELDDLRAALERAKSSSAPAEAAVTQEVKQRQQALEQRQSVLAALTQGLFEPGRGHAARLQLIAQTIPAVAWVTQLKSDEQLLEITGFTLEPAALNDWVSRLAASSLLQGQTLSTVHVEGVKPGGGLASAASAPAAQTAQWSFNLLSRVAAPAAVPPVSTSGAKP